MERRDYYEYFTHSQHEHACFPTCEAAAASLYAARIGELEPGDSICGHREYEQSHVCKGWETYFWLHCKADTFGRMRGT